MTDITSEDRKRKLQEIRNKARNKDDSATIDTPIDDNITDSGINHDNNKKIKFRNYQPYDPKLKELVTQSAELKESQINKNEKLNSNDNNNSIKETDIIKNELSKYDNINEINIIPKKLNWDLKVQIEDKLQKLKNKTQKAIVEILREKFAINNENEE